MIYFIPNTTPTLGPVTKDGKQAISIYDTKNDARKTYVTDKQNVDDYMSARKSRDRSYALTLFSGALGIMSASLKKAKDLPAQMKGKILPAACVFGGISLLSLINTISSKPARMAS